MGLPKTLLRQCGVVFAPLMAEVWAVHRLFHESFGRDNVVLGIYSRDVYVPALLGALLLFCQLQRKQPLTVRLQPVALVVNLVFIALSMSLLLHYPYFQRALGAEIYAAALVTSCIAVLLSAFFLFLSLQEVRARLREFGVRSVYLGLAFLVLVAYPILLTEAWPPLAVATERSVSFVLNAIGVPVKLRPCRDLMVITSPVLTISINMGCSGLEGIFFFSFTFLLFRLLDPKLLRGFRAVTAALAGLLMMFVLNVFRIAAFFCVSLFMIRHSFPTEGREFLAWAFHENVGWLFYFTGIALFFWFLYRRPRPQEVLL